MFAHMYAHAHIRMQKWDPETFTIKVVDDVNEE